VDEVEKQRIMDEARQNLADRDKFDAYRPPPPLDPLVRWRREAEAREAEVREAKQELRAEERRRDRARREAVPDAQAWNAWFEDRLRNYLPEAMDEALNMVLRVCGEGIRDLLIENERQHQSELNKLRLELLGEITRLATTVSQMKTDAVLASAPGASNMRSVN
jgi:hypothetical protein